MTITREQVADLQPGDVVEVSSTEWPEGTVVRGPLWMFDGETLQVGRVVIRHWDGRHPFDDTLTLTVISRAPRPLYVNHPRPEPVPGDVVRDADDPRRIGDMWMYVDGGRKRPWVTPGENHLAPDEMPARLRLLVDGETGQVVP